MSRFFATVEGNVALYISDKEEKKKFKKK